MSKCQRKFAHVLETVCQNMKNIFQKCISKIFIYFIHFCQNVYQILWSTTRSIHINLKKKSRGKQNINERKKEVNSRGLFIYRGNREIDFHDVNNLNLIVLNFPVAPHRPGRLCQSSPTSLLYVDNTKVQREIRWLDCSTMPPKLATVTDSITSTPRPKMTHITLQCEVFSICCVQNEDKQLLLTTHGRKGVACYDVTKDRLDWCLMRNLPGMEKEINASSVTTDGNGHLYVCDTNNYCVHMFSLEGLHLGTLQQGGERGLGNPWRVLWCNRTSSLVTLHLRQRQYRVRKMSVDQEYLEKVNE